MKTYKLHSLGIVLVFVLTTLTVSSQTSQQKMEAMLDTASIEEQVEGVIDIARVYNDHKVIKVSVANTLKRQVLDTLKNLKSEINANVQSINKLENTIDTLNTKLATTQEKLNKAIETKQSILVLGAEINKTVYNSVMWFLLAALIALIVILGLMYKRSHSITIQTKKDLDELKTTYEQYRTDARERYEKMVVKHHQELKKYKEM